MDSYEKKYKEALERAKQIHNEHRAQCADIMTKVFPELKESEDERIRKDLIVFVKGSISDKKSEQRKAYLAWIKKQGDPADINPSEFDLRLNKLLKQFESLPKEELASSLNFYLNVVQNDGIYKEEKQGEQSKKVTYTHEVVTGNGNIKALVKEEIPADKVEPKFHEGEWLCENKPNNYARFIQILEIVNVQGKKRYRISRDIHNDEDIVEFDFVEKYYHTFGIQDAKDGDVLASELCDSIILFRGIKNDNIDFYCDYDFSKIDVPGDRFTFNNGQHYGNVEDSKDFHPATKEQRDTLMKAMVDAGYTFDFEKKELKKIEQNTAWSEEDERIYQSIMDDSVQENQLNDKQTNWLRDIKYRYFPQPKQEWSEEDEIGFRDAMWAIEQARTIAKDENDMGNIWYAENWLKSLEDRVQPKQEWSEEDDYNLQCMIAKVTSDIQKGNVGRNQELIDWLKSLRPQNTWKPSEEQLEALNTCIIEGQINYVGQGTKLQSLYNALKVL